MLFCLFAVYSWYTHWYLSKDSYCSEGSLRFCWNPFFVLWRGKNNLYCTDMEHIKGRALLFVHKEKIKCLCTVAVWVSSGAIWDPSHAVWKSPKCRNCHWYLFLCGHLRNLIYESSVEAEEDLITWILAAGKAIEGTPFYVSGLQDAAASCKPDT